MRKVIYFILFGKEGDTMMAMLWAQKIMSADTVEEARKVYARVPRLLRDQVKEILIESGMEELAAESDE